MPKTFLIAIFAVIAALFGPSLNAQVRDSKPVPVQLSLTEEMIERGVHGTIIFTATVDAQNKIAALDVDQGSGSVELDEYAAEKLMGGGVASDLFDPDVRTLQLEVELYSYDLGLNFGGDYFCEQAVRDHDWFRTIKPDEEFDRGRFYNFVGGMALISQRKEIHHLRKPENRDAAWRVALQACRDRPDEPFMGLVIRAGMELEAQKND